MLPNLIEIFSIFFATPACIKWAVTALSPTTTCTFKVVPNAENGPRYLGCQFMAHGTLNCLRHVTWLLSVFWCLFKICRQHRLSLLWAHPPTNPVILYVTGKREALPLSSAIQPLNFANSRHFYASTPHGRGARRTRICHLRNAFVYRFNLSPFLLGR